MPLPWLAVLRRCRPWLGTYVEIAADMPEAIEAGFTAVAHVHARMSFHEATSDLAALRDAAPGQVVEVDPETVAVLRLAEKLHADSGGLFDVAVGRQLTALGFLPPMGGLSLPEYGGTASDIEIVDDSHIACHRPVLIDLGGIAKGHAVDLAIAAMQAAGARQGIVNAGGDLRVFGTEAEAVWLRGSDGVPHSEILVGNSALATSSNLLFRRHSRGKQTSPHIGRGRRPVLSDHAVTVRAALCAVADAMTKVALADPALAESVLARIGGSLIVSPPHGLAA